MENFSGAAARLARAFGKEILDGMELKLKYKALAYRTRMRGLPPFCLASSRRRQASTESFASDRCSVACRHLFRYRLLTTNKTSTNNAWTNFMALSLLIEFVDYKSR